MDVEVAEGKALMGRLQELTGDLVDEVTIALVISALRVDALNQEEVPEQPDEDEDDIRWHHEQLLSWQRAGYATFAETPDG